jgi:hypothetical protein
MKKNILIAILSIACIGSLSWNYTRAARAMPAPLVIETDQYTVGAEIIDQFRDGNTAGTFEVIPPDPGGPNTGNHTIVLTYEEE